MILKYFIRVHIHNKLIQVNLIVAVICSAVSYFHCHIFIHYRFVFFSSIFWYFDCVVDKVANLNFLCYYHSSLKNLTTATTTTDSYWQ